MHYVEILPCPALRDYIECFWYEIKVGVSATKHDFILPDGCYDLVFVSGEGYKRVSLSNPNETKDIKRAIVAGQRKKAFKLIEPQDGGVDIGARFKPMGLFPFVNINLRELYNDVISLSLIFGNEVEVFEESISEKKNIQDKIDEMEKFLLSRLSYVVKPNSLVVKAIMLAQKSHGNIKVSELIRILGVSKSTLENYFIQWTGLTPKEFLKIWRFNYIFYFKKKNPDVSLTQLGLNAGYYDQAHFIKDFRFFTGHSPSEFFSNRYPLTEMIATSVENRKVYYI